MISSRRHAGAFTLFTHAECVYTLFMRFRLSFVLLATFFLASTSLAEPSPHELLSALNALQLNPQQVFTVTARDRIELRKADIVLSFQDGKIAFFQTFEGRVTGFVFSGIGHILARPRDPVEKQQLARSVGTPVLDQQFLSAYIRFTDDTEQSLLNELQRAGLSPSTDRNTAILWQANIARLNPSHSTRILLEQFTRAPKHFFHAGIDGVVTGPFDVLLDDMREDNVFLGQPRAVNKISYYDVWAAYRSASSSAPDPPMHFDALRYRLDTVIRPNHSLEGDTSVLFKTTVSSDRFLFVQLSRSLKVESVALENGADLPFLQNEGLTQQEINTRGEDTLCVFLPLFPEAGSEFTIHFRYSGNVIEDAGNGVLVVNARESWYPRYGDTSEFAEYEMAFHWPKRLRMVASGVKSNEHEEGEFRSATWKTEFPVPEAGFNLGEYASTSISSGTYTIDVYANKQLEDVLAHILSVPDVESTRSPRYPSLGGNSKSDISMPPPSPADTLKQLARDIDSSIHYYELYSGPFPFHQLGVSQIPGAFGQGWPGLLYLSTFSYLPQDAQSRAGLSYTSQAMFHDVIPFHEVAHQWWGNVVGWSSYRDQWINESIASYLSLLFADSQKNPQRNLRGWLDNFRKRLTTKEEGEDRAPGDIGPLTAGMRLSSSRSPQGYNEVVYTKGPWIIHMLRELLRQPNSNDPDARFIALLHTLVTKYAHTSLSTGELQKEIETVMTPKMDLEGGRSLEWFFAEYVRGTGIPHYKIEFTAKPSEKGFHIRGKLLATGVPRSFIAPVPVYAVTSLGKSTFLGTVVTTGEETSFSFNSPSEPRKLQIDPQMTLLCIPE